MFVDVSFINNRDLSSQISYVIVLTNKQKKDSKSSVLITSNILYQSSTKYKRITRLVLTLELYTIVVGFDSSLVIYSTINSILKSKIPLIVYTNLYLLYNYITKLGTTTKKRLIIDIIRLQQSYKQREIIEVRQINSNYNLANVITKEKLS